MTNEELIELTQAIDNINADLYNSCRTIDKRGKEHVDPWIWMELHYGLGGDVVVKFLDEYMYNSEQENREFIVDKETSTKDHYEPFEPFLRKQANELLVKLQKIKL